MEKAFSVAGFPTETERVPEKITKLFDSESDALRVVRYYAFGDGLKELLWWADEQMQSTELPRKTFREEDFGDAWPGVIFSVAYRYIQYRIRRGERIVSVGETPEPAELDPEDDWFVLED